jgi:hypothetical protein
LARSPITIAKRIFPIQDTGKPPAELTIAPNSANHRQPPVIPVGIPSQLLVEQNVSHKWAGAA